MTSSFVHRAVIIVVVSLAFIGAYSLFLGKTHDLPQSRWDYDSKEFSDIPDWDGVNAPILSVPDAVELALADVEKAVPSVRWVQKSIEFGKYIDDKWVYEISFRDFEWKEKHIELRRVTLDGRVIRLIRGDERQNK